LPHNKSLDQIRLSVTALAWQGPRQSALTGQLNRWAALRIFLPDTIA